jgi:hypothetical protein
VNNHSSHRHHHQLLVLHNLGIRHLFHLWYNLY